MRLAITDAILALIATAANISLAINDMEKLRHVTRGLCRADFA
jgi:hypothetical protein